jgi:hypothetical protein
MPMKAVEFSFSNIEKIQIRSKITKNVIIDFKTGCWNWTKSISDGYGIICLPRKQFANSRIFHAHRISFIVFKQNVSGDLVIDHICRNRKCGNPDQLQARSNYENITEDRVKKNHWKKGHKYNKENTWENNVRRRCRTCDGISYRKRKMVIMVG